MSFEKEMQRMSEELMELEKQACDRKLMLLMRMADRASKAVKFGPLNFQFALGTYLYAPAFGLTKKEIDKHRLPFALNNRAANELKALRLQELARKYRMCANRHADVIHAKEK